MTNYPGERHPGAHDIIDEALASVLKGRELSPSLLLVARSAAEIAAAHTMPLLEAATRERDVAIEESMRDNMTGLDNRRGFNKSLGLALEFAWGHSLPVSAVFMYFDNLKHINDTAGHKAGDDAIINAARCLQQNSLMDDSSRQFGCQLRGPARFESGDDFGVLILGPTERAEAWWEGMDRIFMNEGIVMRVGIGSYDPSRAGLEHNTLVESTYDALLLARSHGEMHAGGSQ